jgi:hypothetical protein
MRFGIRKARTGILCSLLMVCGVVHAQNDAPTIGGACDRAQWGQLTDNFIGPVLQCVHGIWKDASKLAMVSMSVVVKDKAGNVLASYYQAVRDGTEAPIGSWSEQGVPKQGPNGSLSVVMTKFGNWGSLMPTVADDGATIRVEGSVTHADQDASWNQPLDLTMHTGEQVVAATRPDGTTINVRAQKMPG